LPLRRGSYKGPDVLGRKKNLCGREEEVRKEKFSYLTLPRCKEEN